MELGSYKELGSPDLHILNGAHPVWSWSPCSVPLLVKGNFRCGRIILCGFVISIINEFKKKFSHKTSSCGIQIDFIKTMPYEANAFLIPYKNFLTEGVSLTALKDQSKNKVL